MWEVLEKTIVRIGSPQHSHEFLMDVLTPAERIMVAKRLAIAVLLIRGYDYRQIEHILKVSTSTILSVFKQLCVSGAGYRRAANQIISDRNRGEFFRSLEKEIWTVFAGSRTVKNKIEASYQKSKYFRESTYI